MAYNGSGTFSIINTFVYDTVISETDVNANFSDIATGLSTAITKDGQTTITANIPMANYKFTGLGAGSAAGDSANLGQVQAQAYAWGATAGGTADALTITPSPAITAYAAGQVFRFIAASNNTGAATIAISGLTTKALQKNGSALSADDIVSGKIYEIIYDGTQFQIEQISEASFSAAVASDLNTGTSTTKFNTPDALAGSNYGTAVVPIIVFNDATDCATGDGAGDIWWRVPSILNGFDLVGVAACVQTAGTTGTMDIQIHNVTQAADMLTTKITIDSAETDSATAATPAVIDTTNDDVATGDQIRIDVDAVHTTPAKGLLVELQFRLP